jgi:prepilin-type processing-associated H-X9-DG protein
MNEHVAELGPAALPNVVLLFETHPGWNQVGGSEILTTENHRGDGCNVLFVDSHVEFVKTQALSRLRWKPD